MNTKICTSKEQSKKLIELGIDVNTANMYYPYLGSEVYGDTPRVGDGIEYSGKSDIPAWSLSALLNILECPSLSKLVGGEWIIGDWSGGYPKNKYGYDNPLDAAFEMIVWLKENKKI